MHRRISALYAILAILVTLQAGWLSAQNSVPDDSMPEPPANTSEAEKTPVSIHGEPIDTGFVLIDGKYLESPYTVNYENDTLNINGHAVVVQLPPHMMRTPEPWRGPGPGSWQRGDRPMGGPWGGGGFRAPAPDESWIPRLKVRHTEEQLHDGATIVAYDNEPALFIINYLGVMMLDKFLSEKNSDKIVAWQDDLNTEILPAYLIERALADFEPNAQLSARIPPLKEQYAPIIKVTERNTNKGWLSSKSAHAIRYWITVIAMVFGVVAFGILLNHRPETKGKWREINDSDDSTAIVKWCIIMLFLLGLFDLGCTILASRTGTFIELNPLGNSLAENAIALSAFKAASLIFGCGILFYLRRYRGAQLASWWMALVCVVVTFRWAAFNSIMT